MISFRVNAHRFQLRAGAIALEKGHLLLHRLEGDSFWALPGGRVEAGEEATHAVVREFREELGVTVKCHELLCVGENFFTHDGESHHEVGLYFRISLPLDARVLDVQDLHAGHEGSRPLHFKWFPLSGLQEIDLRPAELRRALHSGEVPTHFVQHG